MAGQAVLRLIMAVAALAALAGCQEGAGPFASKPAAGKDAASQIKTEVIGAADDSAMAADDAAPTPVTGAKSVKLVDRDVEAPEIFQTSDQALWDGRPSLGGVWVASPDANDPERVILRNLANGKFVIGALFRRERDNPGPTLQISSDAAAALGLLAGQPGKVSVTALRREEAARMAPDASKPILDMAETVDTEVVDPVAIASAAIDKADAGQAVAKAGSKPEKAAAAKLATAKPAVEIPAASKPAASGGGLIQIGIFSVEANANRAAAALVKAGISADIRKEASQGKSFWSVTARGDSGVMGKIKQAGFKDAYFLKG